MLNVSRQSSSPTLPPSAETDKRKNSASSVEMDLLLAKLKRSMVELILQGDDVTRQMWQMYTVFEEIFGLQKVTSKSSALVKPVVVGDRLKQQLASELSIQVIHNESEPDIASTTSPSHTIGATFSTSVATPTSESITTATTISSNEAPTVTAITTTSSPSARSSPIATSENEITTQSSPAGEKLSSAGHSKENQMTLHRKPFSVGSGSSLSDNLSTTGTVSTRTSNPLLDTIGALTTGSNPDSDDSDLDIVYQQLRYRGRQRKPEQVRIRTQRSHHRHHQHFASSDPESTSYAGSNSIDSGYKSQCATPEVSDSVVGMPEVRRSASDVSASDSSTTSGRPRSSDDDSKSTKIKMGTKAIAGKIVRHHFQQGSRPRHHLQPPLLESSMSDVTLDHLMYLRQSLRKDRQDYLPSSSQGSGFSSSASSTVRDELSPSGNTDEENGEGWIDKPLRISNPHSPRQKPYPFLASQQFSASGPPYHSGILPRAIEGGLPRRVRRMSAGDTPLPEATGGSSSDFLLSGMEYYDLDSIQEFPHRRSSYVTTMEEKARCARINMMAASKRDMPLDRRMDPTYKKKKDYSSYQHTHVPPPPADMDHYYDVQRRGSRDLIPQRSHHHISHRADSKLTEAAIRVLEMIEDFRMEEAMGNARSFDKSDARGRYSSNLGPHAFVPRFRRTTTTTTTGTRAAGLRPSSTGSLIADTHNVATTAEHHVYEEIMYDLVCERSSSSRLAEQPLIPPPPERCSKSHNRLLPASPHAAPAQHAYTRPVHPDIARMTVRSHKHHRSSNLYSLVSDHDSRNVDRFLDVDWGISHGRRDNLSPEFPV